MESLYYLSLAKLNGKLKPIAHSKKNYFLSILTYALNMGNCHREFASMH